MLRATFLLFIRDFHYRFMISEATLIIEGG